MKVRILVCLLLAVISGVRGQNTLHLTFTAVHNTSRIQLDSIKLMNRTQGGSVRVYWPDTTITYQAAAGDLLLYVGYAMDVPVGIGHVTEEAKEFRLFQSIPNPVREQSEISVYLPSKGALSMTVWDVRGRIALNLERELHEGMHSFRFYPGNEGIYFLTARWNGILQSTKILTQGLAVHNTCRLEYFGSDPEKPFLKQSRVYEGTVVQQSGILGTPHRDTTYTFQFATNIPCPGTPTVEYEGQVYNTIQIFSQCWLKENLNVGNRINLPQNQTNNGIKEKYCYDNVPENCAKYGGLYQWDEMMLYSDQEGTQGICPAGWHLPTNEEWKVLEGAVDSLYRFGDPEWDSVTPGFHGYNAGKNLKAANGWNGDGNGVDLFGFSAFPGGNSDTSFCCAGDYGLWWTSTPDSWGAWFRYLYYASSGIVRFDYTHTYCGRSVRCIRNQ